MKEAREDDAENQAKYEKDYAAMSKMLESREAEKVTLEKMIVGYAQLPAFRGVEQPADAAEASQHQPQTSDAAPVWLNEGAFQLPIHLGAPAARAPFTATGVQRFP